MPSNSFFFEQKNARLLTDISAHGNYLGVNMSSWIFQLGKTNTEKRWQRETIRLPFVRQKGRFLEAFWLVFGSPICCVCHIYPWNPNDLYFWRDPTPQKQGRNSNQNKGPHLGSRSIHSFTINLNPNVGKLFQKTLFRRRWSTPGLHVSHRVHGTGIFTGRYTSPMDPMGYVIFHLRQKIRPCMSCR